jgi:lysosomal acid lipase/cholesteryl ester hydrolase
MNLQDVLDKLTDHVSPRISVKQVEHFAQLIFSGKFRQFDYHWGNQAVYNSTTPPDYDLTKVTAPVYLYQGEEDLIISKTVS